MIDLKAIRTDAEASEKMGITCEVEPATIIALLDRLEAAEAQLAIYEKHGVTCQTFGHKLTGCAECNRDDAMESINETNAVLAGNYFALLPKLEAAEKDAARVNWLEQNLFSRENVDPFTKNPCLKFNMWVLFSPVGTQGSARAIIDAAMNEQKK